MSDEGIAPDVRSLITSCIDSVVQLEVLLLLHAQPDKRWVASDLARELRIDSAWAEGQLAQLCARNLLTCSSDPAPIYQYGPGTSDLERAVAGLAQAYMDRRVSVISLIYSKPADALRSFSDAFKLRKDNQDG